MKDKVSMIVRGMIILFLFFNSVVFQYIPFIMFHANVSDYSGNIKLACLLSTFADLILFIIILCTYKKDLEKEFEHFMKHMKQHLDVGFGCWVGGLIIMFAVNYFLVSILHSKGANNENTVRAMMHAYPFIMSLNVCILAPFVEEVVFRKVFKDVFKNPYLFVAISFLVFGIAHVSGMATNWIDWLYVIPYGSLGGAFAYAYYKTDTIFTSMSFHIIHNTAVSLLIFLFI